MIERERERFFFVSSVREEEDEEKVEKTEERKKKYLYRENGEKPVTGRDGGESHGPMSTASSTQAVLKVLGYSCR